MMSQSGLSFPAQTDLPSPPVSEAPDELKDRGNRTHMWILSAVLLFEIFLFALFFRWNTRDQHPQIVTGEHWVIEGDGLGYYAWLSSPLIDGDWDFDNQFNEHNPSDNWLPTDRTDLGRRANPFPVGPALLWAPAVCLAHGACSIGAGAQWPANGYSAPYQLAVGISAMLVAALTLLCVYGICRQYARSALAALATAFVILGTMLVNYSAIMVTWGHGSGIAATSLLIWFWLKTYGSQKLTRWLIVGSLVGLAALMRWQLAILALLPTGEFLLSALNTRRNERPRELGGRFAKLAIAGLMAIVAFLPQLYAWKAVYGHWFVTPIPLAHHWWSPALSKVLFGVDRSFFYWTPMTVVILLGLLFGAFRRRPQPTDLAGRREPLAILLFVFAVLVYFIASVMGDGVYVGSSYNVNLGSAFGFRSLSEAVVVLAPGLAIVLESASVRTRRWLIAGCFLVTVWNALMLAQFHFNILPKNAGAAPFTLLNNVPRLIRGGHGFVYFLMGPTLLGAVVLLCRRSERRLRGSADADASILYRNDIGRDATASARAA